MSNKEIRAIMKQEKIFIWQIAEVLSLHETTMIKRFRTEMTDEQKQQVLSAIEEIKSERQEGKEYVKN